MPSKCQACYVAIYLPNLAWVKINKNYCSDDFPESSDLVETTNMSKVLGTYLHRVRDSLNQEHHLFLTSQSAGSQQQLERWVIAHISAGSHQQIERSVTTHISALGCGERKQSELSLITGMNVSFPKQNNWCINIFKIGFLCFFSSSVMQITGQTTPSSPPRPHEVKTPLGQTHRSFLLSSK